jgi:hypothetical protein
MAYSVGLEEETCPGCGVCSGSLVCFLFALEMANSC